jgi:hypothetical protein
MQTKTEKIIAWFIKNPNADVKKTAAKFKAAVPMVYKLRKRALATTEAEDTVTVVRNKDFSKPIAGGRRVSLNSAHLAIAKKLRIPLDKFVEEGLKNGTLQYDDERLAVEDAGEDTVDDVLNARAKNYGKFIEGAEIMQMIKRLVYNYVHQRNTALAFDQLEAIDMIIHKLGRIINGNPDHTDSWVDIAGYAMLVADRLEGKAR